MSAEPIPATSPTKQPASGVRTMLRHRASLVVGVLGLTIILFCAVFAPLLTSYDVDGQDVLDRRLPPIWTTWTDPGSAATPDHILGTDNLGRDYWTRLIYGARISLIVGFAGALISGLIGTAIGVSAGYFGGRADLAANFIIQTRLSIPVMLVALASVTAFGGSLVLIIALCGIFLWDRAAVVTRTVTRQIVALDYVLAAKAIGLTSLEIILQVILPNLVTPLIIVLTIEMGQAILFEAALSFLGLGVAPPAPSWGLMLAEGKEDIFFAPWAITLPGAALFLLVLSTTLIGEGLQHSGDRPSD
jgi:peptide/nickel transport system permease protein